MRAYIAFILFLIPVVLSAQVKKHKRKPIQQIHKQSVSEFYSNQKLIPDSAITPFLYYKVYDWIGTRYKYSGDTKKGIDCSGFVCEMYEEAYCINLQGGSRDLWTTVKPIEKEDLKEGDILFFKIKKGQISHVGIYLGNNKFAHASVQSGVTINDLSEDYYKKYFYKGGRLIE